MSQPILLADFLRVRTDKIRTPLYAYQLEIAPRDRPEVGKRIAYPAQTYFNDPKKYWTWSQAVLVSNACKSPEALAGLCRHLWQTHPEKSQQLRAIQPIDAWQPNPQALADYAQQIVRTERRRALQQAVQKYDCTVGEARIERSYKLRAWVLQGQPVLSIALESHAILKSGFGQIEARLQDIHDLIGTWVQTPSENKGRITGIIGPMQDHRDRLLLLAKSEQMQQRLPQTPDTAWVVQLDHRYDYPLDCLHPSLSMDAMAKFGLNLPQVTAAFRLKPGLRRQIFQDLARAISPAEPDWVTSARYPESFISAAALPPPRQVRFGQNQRADHDPNQLMQHLKNYGVYQTATVFREHPVLRIGLIDARRDRRNPHFKPRLIDTLRAVGFRVEFTAPERVETVSQATLEAAVDRLEPRSPHIILGLLPQKRPGDESIYTRLKRLTVGRDLPSQMIYESTLRQKHAVNNVVMGILAKTGNTLFTLAEPLEFADFVVGLDVARERKQHLSGSINTTAIARVYTNGGQLLGYQLCDDTLAGETLPRQVLESLFPQQHFTNKRVIIHRDGPFRGQEKLILQEIAASLNTTFHCVEIRKSGAPRLYRELADPVSGRSRIHLPQKGDWLKLSETQALVISSLPAHSIGTPQPLHICCEPELGIARAIESVFALTLLHLGSVRQPRLPVSIHYSDKIGGMALKGIKPKSRDGTIPFWL